jgi:hypothetical protein
MKEHMIEAVKRKRAMIQQHEEDSKGPHAEGQSAQTGDEELAPESGSSNRDALLGKPGGTNHEEDAESPEEEGNDTELGEEGGFDHISKDSAPENSKVLFQDPKKDTHDEADPNMHRNMAGDGGGLATKYDKMGVKEHTDPRLQSSHMAKRNMGRAEGVKSKEHALVAQKTHTQAPRASHGEDVHDAVAGDNEQMQGYSPLKKARAKLDGFLGKLKNS